MMQSLDGYVCGGAELPGLGVGLHRYFNDFGGRFGRGVVRGGIYEVMRHWGDDRAEGRAAEDDA
ncbi:MAG: hypothetical protein WDN04_23200 [Rhodospirillales bacterium]